jgi:muconolactone delta-isomerase
MTDWNAQLDQWQKEVEDMRKTDLNAMTAQERKQHADRLARLGALLQVRERKGYFATSSEWDIAAQDIIDEAVAEGRLIRFIGEDGKPSVVIERELAMRLLRQEADRDLSHADQLERWGKERQS